MAIYVNRHPEVQKNVWSFQEAGVTLDDIYQWRGGRRGRGEISQVKISKHFIELKIFISSLPITYMYS
jgi:hypothetical protein